MNTHNAFTAELARLGFSLSNALGLCSEPEDPRLDKADCYAWWTWFANVRGR